MTHIDMVVYFYQTKPGDTMAKIAHDVCKDSTQVNDYIKHLATSYGNNHPLLPYFQDIHKPFPTHSVIALGGNSDQYYPNGACQLHQARVHHAINQVNQRSMSQRWQISKILNSQIPISIIAAVIKVLEEIEEYVEKHKVLIGASIALMEQRGEYRLEQGESFMEEIKAFNKRINTYLKTPVDQRSTLRQGLLEQQKRINVKFTDMTKQVLKKSPSGQIELVKDTKSLYQHAKAKPGHFNMLSPDELKTVARSTRYAKYIGRSMLFLEVGLAGLEVGKAYVDHENWLKVLVEEMEGIAVGGLAAYGTVLFVATLPITAPSLIVILAAGGASLGGNVIGKALANFVWNTTDDILNS